MASSAPMLSSVPLRMWCTRSLFCDRSQHFPSLPGSHQQARSSAPAAHDVTGRHLITCSSNVGRCARFMIGFIVPGLLTESLGIPDVSTVPGRVCENVCHSMLLSDIPEAKISEMRPY